MRLSGDPQEGNLASSVSKLASASRKFPLW